MTYERKYRPYEILTILHTGTILITGVVVGGPRAFFDPPRPLCFWFSSVTDLKLTPSSQSGDM